MKFVHGVLVLVVTLLFEDFSAAELTAPTAKESVSGVFNYLNRFGIPKAISFRKVEEGVHKLTTFNNHHEENDDIEILNKHTSNNLRKNVSMKIVQGSRAKLGQFPYQAGLLVQPTGDTWKNYECGASLISTTRLVTAAHCWLNTEFQAEYFIVVLGSISLYEGGRRIKTKNVTLHEHYNKDTPDNNDIAIISIPSVRKTKYIQPIALPPPAHEEKSFAGYTAVASGFGHTYFGTGFEPSILMYVNLKVTLGGTCSRYYNRQIRATEICTKGVYKRNICFGDSGGPLVIEGINGKHVLIGVTSFGEPDDCLAGAPSGFTRITSFLAWIQKHMIS